MSLPSAPSRSFPESLILRQIRAGPSKKRRVTFSEEDALPIHPEAHMSDFESDYDEEDMQGVRPKPSLSYTQPKSDIPEGRMEIAEDATPGGSVDAITGHSNDGDEDLVVQYSGAKVRTFGREYIKDCIKVYHRNWRLQNMEKRQWNKVKSRLCMFSDPKKNDPSK